MKQTTISSLTYLVVLLMLLVPAAGCKSDQTVYAVGNGNSASDAVAVEVKDMAYEPFSHSFAANGMVEAVKDAFISPEQGGQIKSISVREGDRVRAGQLLATLNTSVIEKGIAEARTQLQLAQTVYARQKELWDKQIGSEIQFLQAKTAKDAIEDRIKSLQAQLELSQIKAPIDGIVDTIAAKEGELAAPGVMLLRVIDLRRIYIKADVSESYLAKIKPGDPVTVEFPSYPDLAVKTTIQRIGNVVNPDNRTVKVTLALDNVGEKLKPNLMAVIRMEDFRTAAALVLPSIIIKKDMNGSYVYQVRIEKEKSIASKLYLTPGITENSLTQITSGLEPGQRIIVKGYNLVKNGVEITIAK